VYAADFGGLAMLNLPEYENIFPEMLFSCLYICINVKEMSSLASGAVHGFYTK
jgi:hypothetical protein